jgi:hypothetical protein
MHHCCEKMDDYLKNSKIPIFYKSWLRKYYIPLQQAVAIQLISFCPWCGKHLPKDLGDEWFNILEKDYHIEDPFSSFRQKDGKIPEEFMTDEWWKKRGL